METLSLLFLFESSENSAGARLENSAYYGNYIKGGT